ETELFHEGVRPAVNPGISVSRVGGNAQIKAMKKVAGTLKLIYSQYRELASFAQFGSDLDEDTKARLDQGARIVEVLKQNRGTPIPVEKQVAIIFAVVRNHLKEVSVDQVAEYESDLYDFLDSNDKAKALMDKIRQTGAYDDEIEKGLDATIAEFTSRFVRQQ
ncbi:MAG: F0F1 ATP synthase subunit alpha, partial [Lachnospiraceae bacterium]|nr:F0F1 ATP synthase subunit alpha [Lachnospiraceae bacterium]